MIKSYLHIAVMEGMKTDTSRQPVAVCLHSVHGDSYLPSRDRKLFRKEQPGMSLYFKICCSLSVGIAVGVLAGGLKRALRKKQYTQRQIVKVRE